MRLSHVRRAMSVRFDDPNPVSCAGLARWRAARGMLLAERVRIAARGGANATAKILALVAGVVAGADSISDIGLLRHGGMGQLFDDVRAASTRRGRHHDGEQLRRRCAVSQAKVHGPSTLDDSEPALVGGVAKVAASAIAGHRARAGFPVEPYRALAQLSAHL
jgi:hypothetical protein